MRRLRNTLRKSPDLTAKAEPHEVCVFIHVPKTAGTTVRTVIRTSEPGERNGRPGANVFRGGGGSNPKTLEKLRDEPHTLDLNAVRVLHGHLPFGASQYLERAFPDHVFRYFTFLRDPVERSLSHYFEVLRRPRRVFDDGEVSDELAPLPPGTTFEHAVEAGYLHDNVQTRMLSDSVAPFGPITEKMLEEAKRNLSERFALVGLTERLDESLVLAKQQLGLRNILVASRRVNTSRPRGAQVPAELRDAARGANAYDIELYRFARELFERIAERNQLEFQVELAALRSAKATDSSEPQDPPSPQFHGGEREWSMLIDARAKLLRLERKRTLRYSHDDGDGEAVPIAAGRRKRRRGHGVARRNADTADPPELDDDQPTALVFIDIPASGGGALDLGLPLNRQRRSSRRGPADIFEGVGGIRPRDMEQLRRATQKLTPKGLRILRGSFPFTISAFLVRLADKREFRYMTFLREPVDRAVAHYLQARDNPIEGLVPLQADATFADALEAGYVQDNLQTRMLSGSPEPFGEVTEEMLDAAKRNLRDEFLFVGLAERREESFVLARMRLELGPAIYRQEPPPNQRAVATDLPAETAELARQTNRYDIELYDFAQELFDSAPELSELEFQCEAAAVRASRGDGEIEVTTPVPPAFEGGEQEWQMLVRARAECHRLEWELDEERPDALVPVGGSEADG